MDITNAAGMDEGVRDRDVHSKEDARSLNPTKEHYGEVTALLEWLNRPDILRKPRTRADYYNVVRATRDEEATVPAQKNALCRLKRCEYLRIGARDFLHLATVEETTREISDLAEALIAAAAEISWDQTVARFGQPIAEGGNHGARQWPSRLVELLFYSHPPIAARLEAARLWESRHR